MTPEELDAIEARASAQSNAACGVCMGHSPSWDGHDKGCAVAFLEACRADVPALVAEVRRLWEHIDLMHETWAGAVTVTRQRDEARAEAQRLQKFARIISDLDRSPNGRHEGDAEVQAADGVSPGNPHIREGEVFAYDIGGRPYVMPPRTQRHDPDMWRETGVTS